ncbi:MAG: aspartyl-tRNA(Asn)/glutamyl-tRNA(Gln) amidotransferase subunit [Candidatus Binatota bacterium]|jgi:aspartyl-tRNA(Asn)/glutamyl-tRNA(Gln) amidotransferase subunit C|nr:aspartyl-tRNA(Asn)/glutamyl-tRNA(Gln) amidotransferase subunit [Candidatus Binatota bacterium]
MKISAADIRHVALLARLELDADEERRLGADLQTILDYVEKLRELDTDDVPPTAHALDDAAAFREDEVRNLPDADRLLANAPDRLGGFFRVPKIIE